MHTVKALYQTAYSNVLWVHLLRFKESEVFEVFIWTKFTTKSTTTYIYNKKMIMFTDVKKGYKVIVFFSVQFNMKSSIVSIEIYFSSIEKYLQRIIPWNLTKMKDIGFANIVHGLPEQGRGVDIVFSIENESRVQDKQMEKPTQATQCIAIHMNQCSFGCLSVRYHLTALYPSVNLQCLYRDYVKGVG